LPLLLINPFKGRRLKILKKKTSPLSKGDFLISKK
jgi:hypothetical protein